MKTGNTKPLTKRNREPRRGRPRLFAPEEAPSSLHLTVTAGVRLRAAQRARDEGCTISELMRRALRAYLGE